MAISSRTLYKSSAALHLGIRDKHRKGLLFQLFSSNPHLSSEAVEDFDAFRGVLLRLCPTRIRLLHWYLARHRTRNR